VLRTLDVTVLAAGIALVLGLASYENRLAVTYTELGWALIGLSGMLIIAFASLPLWLTVLKKYLRKGWIRDRLEAFESGMGRAVDRRALTLASVSSASIWLMMVVFATLPQFAFNTPLGLLEAILVSVVVLAFSVLPVHAPLHLGTGDGAWVVALTVAGMNAPQAIAMALAMRFVFMFVVILDSVIALGFITVRNNRANPEGFVPNS
jgi:hypothetical protein